MKTKLGPLSLKNPLLPGSGPLTGDGSKMIELANQGIGGLVTKTIATDGAEVIRPCIVNHENIIMNCEAWSEYDAVKWIETYLPQTREAVDIPLLASVGYTPEDYEYIVPKIDHMVEGYECVVRFHNNNGDYREVEESVQAFRALTNKPIWVKMSYTKPDAVGFARTCLEGGATGVIAVTSLGPCLAIDIEKRAPLIGLESGYSWASGPAIKPMALATVYTIKREIPEISIIGSGGIASAKDVIEFLLAGADAVEMLSGALMKGQGLFGKIVRELPDTLKKYGFTSIEEVKTCGLNPVDVTIQPSFPIINKETCTSCKICALVCPYDAMKMEDDYPVVNKRKCFGCGLCETKCPVKAISNVL